MEPLDTEQGLGIFAQRATDRIRKVWLDGEWWFSVIDVIAVLTDAPKPRKYWTDMKRRITDEGFHELAAKCRQLKLQSADGKYYTSEIANTETLLRITQSIPSPKAEPFKQWLAKVGVERLREEAEPSLAVERLRRTYIRKGYSDEWIAQRLDTIGVRNVLTTEWQARGAREGKTFAMLTDTLNVGTFDVTTREHKTIKTLTAQQNLEDSMTVMELALKRLAEATAATLHRARDSQGVPALHRDATDAGQVGGDARKQVEALTGESVVSPINFKHLQQERQHALQQPLFEETDDA